MRFVLLVCLSLFAAPAGADFQWRTEAKTGFDHFIKTGDDYLETAIRRYRRDPGQAKALAKRAIRNYERASAIEPKNPEAHFRVATAIYYFLVNSRGDGVVGEGLANKLIRHWDAFEKASPLDPRLSSIWFAKSLTLTRMNTQDAFAKAIALYDRIIPSAGLDLDTFLGNKAELHMMRGELDDSIEAYTQAYKQAGGRNLWYRYGLAVALDRDGQTMRAREVMKDTVPRDRQRGNFMASISNGSVFFVPPGERFYYLALGYESIGNYPRAESNYKKFIASGAHPRFHARARVNLKRVSGKPNTAAPRSRLGL